jgi:hypothetical protein
LDAKTAASDKKKRAPATGTVAALAKEPFEGAALDHAHQPQDDDQAERNSKKPKKNRHDDLLSEVTRKCAERSIRDNAVGNEL